MNIDEIMEGQRGYFRSGATRPYSFRIEMLNKLASAIKNNEAKICAALKEDLNRSDDESYMVEIGPVLAEITYLKKRLKGWMKVKKVTPEMAVFPAKSRVYPEPYGLVLIASPWNYPFNMCFNSLAGAIAAGNCVVIKPSSYSPASSHVIAELIGETFDASYITVVEGSRKENSILFSQKFDKIFFTGSMHVGKTVLEAAAANLVPVTLELGGKSPVIIDSTADIKLAAKRVMFGKVLNAGQTCIAPDYVMIAESKRDEFVECCRAALAEFFPEGSFESMPAIINRKHVERLLGILEKDKMVIGGEYDADKRFIAPVVMTDITPDSPAMQAEIFGPILPVMTYPDDDIGRCIEFIQSRNRPLALYLFTRSKAVRNRVFNECSFGGGCVNDVIMHILTPRMPFGGVGASGMGSYHGKQSFDTFSHYRSVMEFWSKIDLPLRYRPYSDKKTALIKSVLK